MAQKGIWIDRNTFVAFSESTGSLSKEIATRDRSIDFYALGMYLPNPDPVLKKKGQDIKIYMDLLSDAHVGACVINRKAGVKSLNWSIDRGKAKSRQAKIIEDAFNGLAVDRIISQILDAPLYGYQFLEVMWKKIGQWWLPVDVMGKPQHWFVFDTSNIPKFRTRQNWNGEDIPDNKFLIASHDPTYYNPYGVALLSRCFWPVVFKKGGFKFWVKMTEKYGMPFLLGKLPRGKEQKEYDELYGMLEAMIQDAIAVIPDDGSVEMLEASSKGGGGTSADIYQKLLSYCDSEVSKAIVGQTLTTEIGTTGSYGASKTHMEVRDEIVIGDKRICEEVFNTLIKWTCEYNFGPGEIPAFSLWQEEDVDKDLAERDKNLSDTGQIRFTKKYFMKEYGFEAEDIVVNESMPSGAPKNVGAALALPSGSPGDVSTFAEAAAHLFPDQAAIDNASIKPADLQEQMQGVLKPVIDLINSGKDFNQVLDKLSEAYPNVDDKALMDMLQRAIFVSELWGKLSAGQDSGK